MSFKLFMNYRHAKTVFRHRAAVIGAPKNTNAELEAASWCKRGEPVNTERWLYCENLMQQFACSTQPLEERRPKRISAELDRSKKKDKIKYTNILLIKAE